MTSESTMKQFRKEGTIVLALVGMLCADCLPPRGAVGK